MKTVTRMVVCCGALGMALSPLVCAADAASITIPKDTLVTLRFTDPISTRSSTLGQQVNLRVADDVYVGTDVLIRKDEPTLATVTEVEKPRSWGRSGKLEIEFSTVKAVDGSDVRLGPWTKEKKEGMKTAAGATVGGAVLLGPVGLLGGMFVKGKHVDIPVGKEIVAAVRWDTTVSLPLTSTPSISPAGGPVGALPDKPSVAETPSAPAQVAPAAVNISGDSASVDTPAELKPLPIAPVPSAPVKETVKPVVPVGPPAATPLPAKPVLPKAASPSKATSPVPGTLQKPPATVAPIIPIIEEVKPAAAAGAKAR